MPVCRIFYKFWSISLSFSLSIAARADMRELGFIMDDATIFSEATTCDGIVHEFQTDSTAESLA